MVEWSWQIDGWIVLVGILSAVSCALLGNYLVLRKMSLMGDAISHAVLPGLAIAFLLTASRAPLPMFIGAVVAGTLTAVLTQTITRFGKVEHGAAMGVVFSVLFAVGLVLIRRAADHVDLDPGCVLYGNIVQIPLELFDRAVPQAAINLAAAVGLNVLFVGFFYKELKICAFDPALATSLGINAGVMHYALMIMVAITTVANFESVGSILVIAMLIVPPAAAHLLTDRLAAMIAVSLAIAVASAVLGHVLAVWGPGWVGMDPAMSVNTAAMMTVVAGAFFLAALLLAPRYGVCAKVLHRFSISLQIVREDVLGLLYRWDEVYPEGGRAMRRDEVLQAVGNSLLSRWAIRSLRRRAEIRMDHSPRGEELRLSPAGAARATSLVRSHRLWESYVAKHFALPEDHLHAPAERMEHFITGKMQDAIADDVQDARRDPHGRPIPDRGEEQS